MKKKMKKKIPRKNCASCQGTGWARPDSTDVENGLDDRGQQPCRCIDCDENNLP